MTLVQFPVEEKKTITKAKPSSAKSASLIRKQKLKLKIMESTDDNSFSNWLLLLMYFINWKEYIKKNKKLSDLQNKLKNWFKMKEFSIFILLN